MVTGNWRIVFLWCAMQISDPPTQRPTDVRVVFWLTAALRKERNSWSLLHCLEETLAFCYLFRKHQCKRELQQEDLYAVWYLCSPEARSQSTSHLALPQSAHVKLVPPLLGQYNLQKRKYET